MPVLIIIITCVLVGWIAQEVKHRTGALWGFLTLVAIVPSWFITYTSILSVDPRVLAQAGAWPVMTMLVCLVIGGIMLLIVATLPKVHQASPQAAGGQKP